MLSTVILGTGLPAWKVLAARVPFANAGLKSISKLSTPSSRRLVIGERTRFGTKISADSFVLNRTLHASFKNIRGGWKTRSLEESFASGDSTIQVKRRKDVLNMSREYNSINTTILTPLSTAVSLYLRVQVNSKTCWQRRTGSKLENSF